VVRKWGPSLFWGENTINSNNKEKIRPQLNVLKLKAESTWFGESYVAYTEASGTWTVNGAFKAWYGADRMPWPYNSETMDRAHPGRSANYAFGDGRVESKTLIELQGITVDLVKKAAFTGKPPTATY